MIKIYTDGGFSIPKNKGGWGMVVIDVNENKILYETSGVSTNSTSNRMELTAFLSALTYNKNVLKAEQQCYIVSDSSYVINGYNKWLFGWKNKNFKTASGKEVKNRDLWQLIDSLRDNNITAYWTKSHNSKKSKSLDSYWNDYVDKLTKV